MIKLCKKKKPTKFRVVAITSGRREKGRDDQEGLQSGMFDFISWYYAYYSSLNHAYAFHALFSHATSFII